MPKHKVKYLTLKENNESDQFSLYRDLQKIVNVQIDINRAVWAANLTKATTCVEYMTEAGRDAYVKECLKSAYSELLAILSA